MLFERTATVPTYVQILRTIEQQNPSPIVSQVLSQNRNGDRKGFSFKIFCWRLVNTDRKSCVGTRNAADSTVPILELFRKFYDRTAVLHQVRLKNKPTWLMARHVFDCKTFSDNEIFQR